jgi:hypothetical protein
VRVEGTVYEAFRRTVHRRPDSDFLAIVLSALACESLDAARTVDLRGLKKRTTPA